MLNDQKSFDGIENGCDSPCDHSVLPVMDSYNRVARRLATHFIAIATIVAVDFRCAVRTKMHPAKHGYFEIG